MTKPRTFDWQGVEYQSPEYYRLYRQANHARQLEYHRKYDKRMYRLHPEREHARRVRYATKYPERIKANRAAQQAVATGKLVKQPCGRCGEARVIAHHDDWAKPLEVMWLCEIHHKERHRETK